MDTTAALLKQLEEAQASLHQAERRAEDERQSRKVAEQSRAAAERRAEEAEEKTRPTQFIQFIRECHEHLSKPLQIQADKSLTTKGSVTNPTDRPCPTEIKPWIGFSRLQEERFKEISKCLSQKPGQFDSKYVLQELGKKLCSRPFASEKDLEVYERLAVEHPISSIISALQHDEDACRKLDFHGEIVFENHANTLADGSEEVEQGLRSLRLDPTSSSMSRPKYADQVCVYKDDNGTRIPCMIVEYKPAHKLSVLNFRSGLLRADSGSMHLPRDVFSRLTIPNDADRKFVYHSEWLVSAVFTQTYGYMMENGLEYSYITTGEAFVFVWIPEEEPHTLYYHLTVPNIDVGTDTDDYTLTAISQALCVCTLAMASTPRSQEWRFEAINSASTATMDCEHILQETPVELNKLETPTSEFIASLNKYRRSPIQLRSRQPQLNSARQSCAPGGPDHLHNQSPPPSSDEASDLDTPSKTRSHVGGVSLKKHNIGSRDSNTQQTTAQNRGSYCTQRCLIGLVQGSFFDEECPNISNHRHHNAATRHSLNYDSFNKAMKAQLVKTRDQGCEPLRKQGSRGALFKLTLLSHSYIFVAKGTVYAFTPDLEHEAVVYQHLHDLQGLHIPVYLGSVTLDPPYFYDIGVKIVHMLMMSWGGDQANQDVETQHSRWGVDLLDDRSTSVMNNLLRRGVKHNDARPSNILWSKENRDVMIVDFERSVILREPFISKDMSQVLAQWQQRTDCSSGDLWPLVYNGHIDVKHSESKLVI